MKARIKVTLKNGVLDPQGKAMCEKLIANTVIENYDIELA